MKILEGNCLLAQSGGPTSVINSSAYGIIKSFMTLNENCEVYAGAYGIEGILQKKIFNVRRMEKSTLEGMKYMPSSALGSCRYKLKDFKESPEEYEKLFKIFKELNIRYFFYIGGNDSMDAASKIDDYAKYCNYDIRVLGVPKTIDNDLVETDHCPGFGSAAKFVSNVAMEVWCDINTYDFNSIIILEVMGRDAGWISASSGIIKDNIANVNQLIYIPEIAFSEEKFLQDVRQAYEKNGKLLIVTSEGLKDKNGEYIETDKSGYSSDQFGHRQLGGIGRYLQSCIKNNVESKVKFIELGVTQRCAMHCVSKTDIEEAMQVGKDAVEYTLQGYSGFMTALKREDGSEYKCTTKLVELNKVCNKVKNIPVDWMNLDGTGISKAMHDYIKPLIVGEADIFGSNGLLNYVDINKKNMIY